MHCLTPRAYLGLGGGKLCASAAGVRVRVRVRVRARVRVRVREGVVASIHGAAKGQCFSPWQVIHDPKVGALSDHRGGNISHARAQINVEPAGGLDEWDWI